MAPLASGERDDLSLQDVAVLSRIHKLSELLAEQTRQLEDSLVEAAAAAAEPCSNEASDREQQVRIINLSYFFKEFKI